MKIKQVLDYFEERPRCALAVVAVLLLVIGTCDYAVGADVSLLVMYLIPICFATWVIGKRFALLVALLSLAIWAFANELAAGVREHSPFVSGWNIVSSFAVFAVVVFLLGKFELLLKALEARVVERTLALRRLEQEILEVSEEEQRRIGHDLHDTVCQMLTGTSVAMKVLQRKLEEKGLPEAAEAREVKILVQKSIEMTRDIARGLSPVAMAAEGLMDAFHQLVERVTKRHGVPCALEYSDPLMLHDVNTASHLYLIVQEAVTNAVRHSKARHIVIQIKNDPGRIEVGIADDGVGIGDADICKGLGTRIMQYRALMIGAELLIRNTIPHGTRVTLLLKTKINHGVDVPAQQE